MQVGEGHAALEALELERAEAIFSETLERFPDTVDAACGMRITRFWQQVRAEADSLDTVKRVAQLWQALIEVRGDRDRWTARLEQTLLEQMVTELELSGVTWATEEVCPGRLLLEAGEERRAETWLRRALKREPGHGALLGYLGDALWELDKPVAARISYARALVIDPQRVVVHHLRDLKLRSLVEQRGPGLAPVFGWIAGLLPLLDAAELGAARTAEQQIYRRILAAETARRGNDHDRKISERLWLREHAPEVLSAYMERIESGTIGQVTQTR